MRQQHMAGRAGEHEWGTGRGRGTSMLSQAWHFWHFWQAGILCTASCFPNSLLYYALCSYAIIFLFSSSCLSFSLLLHVSVSLCLSSMHFLFLCHLPSIPLFLCLHRLAWQALFGPTTHLPCLPGCLLAGLDRTYAQHVSSTHHTLPAHTHHTHLCLLMPACPCLPACLWLPPACHWLGWAGTVDGMGRRRGGREAGGITKTWEEME